MRRWLLVLLVAAAVAASLLGVRQYVGQRWVADEILAYEITERQEVVGLVPAVAERLQLTSWLVLGPDPPFDPTRAYDYSLEITLMDSNEQVLFKREFDASSRISGDPGEPIAKGQFAARLVGRSDWVTDSRSAPIDVAALGGRPGLLRIRTADGSLARALVRLSFAQARGELEREVAARTLGVGQRRRLMAGRSALGFADLPPAAQERALGTWGRRLTVRGREGVDYFTRRLLLGGWRFVPEDDPTTYAALALGAGRHGAFNFSGAVQLRAHAPAGTKLQVADGSKPSFEVLVGDGGEADLDLPGEGPRTVVVGAAERTRMHFTMPAAQAAWQIGSVQQVLRGDRVVVRPDIRIQHYLALRRHEPVLVSIAPGQDMVGLSVRARVESSTTAAIDGQVRARWRGVEARAAELEAELSPSAFEVADEQQLTDAQTTLLRVPDGATALEITGDRWLLISPWTREPAVEESLLDPAYDVELGEERAWRHAPHALRSFAPIRAANDELLRAAGRLARVQVQVRIETIVPQGQAIADRVLKPRGEPIVRHLLRPAYHGKGAPGGPTTWTALGEEPIELALPARGPRAGELKVFYRADLERLGGELELWVDGDSVLSRPLNLRTGQLAIPLGPGAHRVRLTGLGEGGRAFGSAPPTAGGGVVKRQRVYELTRKGRLSFEFQRREGELLTLLVFFVSEQKPASYRVYYRIDDGRGQERSRGFVRRMTEFSGILSGRTGARGRGQLWEAGSEDDEDAPRGDWIGEGRVRMGDDLTTDRHRLHLRWQGGPEPLWVRALLVGRALERGAGPP